MNQVTGGPTIPTQFGLRSLLVITAAMAITIPCFVKFPHYSANIVCAGVFAYLVRSCWSIPAKRVAAATLVACMILPFAWVVFYEELDRILPWLIENFAGLPTFYAAAWSAALLGLDIRNSPWIAPLMTAAELAIAIWLIRLGPKRTIAYLTFVMILSAMGSLVFYQWCIF